MTNQKRWKQIIIAAMAVLALAAGATSVFAQTAQIGPFGGSPFSGPDKAGFGPRGGVINKAALLAEALGITVEELQTAQQQAFDAAVRQALAAGLITQEQADHMLLWGGFGRGFGHRGGFGRGFGRLGGAIDMEALLAEQLGITVEDLRAAQQQAHAAGIQQALAEGLITQEQADFMVAASQLRSYLDKEALMAKALGITVEALQAARAEGKSLTDLLNELGLDAVTVRANLQTAHQEAIQQAVDDNVITQEQADQFLNGGPRGFGGRGFHGGRGFKGGRGPGTFDGFQHRPTAPTNTS